MIFTWKMPHLYLFLCKEKAKALRCGICHFLPLYKIKKRYVVIESSDFTRNIYWLESCFSKIKNTDSHFLKGRKWQIPHLRSFEINIHSHDCFSKYIETYLCTQKSVNNRSIPDKKQPWNRDTFSKITRPFPTFQLQSFLKTFKKFLCK